MKYEVLNINNQVMFFTFSEKCIHSKQEIEIMSKAGYKFRLDDKNISKSKLLEEINKMKKEDKSSE